MENEETVCERGYAGVAARRGGRGGAADAVGEDGEEQQAAGVQGLAPRAGDAHRTDAAGGADNDRRGWVGRLILPSFVPAEEQFEELLFDRGLEAADEGGRAGSQAASEVVALDDEVAGALDGAEERNRFTVEE